MQAGRVYFKSALGDAYYYVEMAPGAGHYVGVLPKPRPDAGPITYYVEGVGRDYVQSQTPEQRAIVVGQAGRLRRQADRGAGAVGPGAGVLGERRDGAAAGVLGRVVGGGGGRGRGHGRGGGGGRGGISGTTLLVVGGAVAVGVGTVVLVTTGEKNPPASPSR